VIIMAMVYIVSNPYVAINLVNNPELVRSNLANTSAMYPAGGIIGGTVRSALLVTAGTSLPLAVVGLLGALLLALGKKNPVEGESTKPAHGIGWMLAMMSIIVLIQMVHVAAGKPGEFGRFALLPDVALLIAAFAGLARLPGRPTSKMIYAVVLVLVAASAGAAYETGFLRDCQPRTSRMAAADDLPTASKANSAGTLLLPDDPAPYCLPPVDLYRWRIVLLPKSGPPDESLHGLVVRPDDTISLSPLATPLSWANKTFMIESK